MNRREREALDRHITGNYGEDQFRGMEEDTMDRDKALEVLRRAASLMASHELAIRTTADLEEALGVAIGILSTPRTQPAIRLVRLTFDRHIEGHFFFHDFISLPADAAPKDVNTLHTLAAIWKDEPEGWSDISMRLAEDEHEDMSPE